MSRNVSSGRRAGIGSLSRKLGVALGYLARGDVRGLFERLATARRALQNRGPITHYQSFPEARGSSNSLEKLKALRLPPLAGKSFLDVGCNEGFFCGFAKFQGAARVVGIDNNPTSIAAAQARFPDCEFLERSWDELPEGEFDVILLASALHYAADQPALIKRLIDRLSPTGTLVLELGIAPGAGDAWVKVTRAIDEREFPTRAKIEGLLADYAWKKIGASVPQAGDPIPREVIHVLKRVPIAYLLMQPSAHGKTTISNTLFREAKIPSVSGDRLLYLAANGMIKAPAGIEAILTKDFSSGRIDVSVREIFNRKFAEEYVDLWLRDAGDGDFAFDGFIPREHQPEIVSILVRKGYLPVRLEWDRIADGPSSAVHVETAAARYRDHLASRRTRATVATTK